MSDPSFAFMATVTASTKRPPKMVSGKRGEPELKIPAFKCLPIDPLTPEVAIRMGLEAPYIGWQTFAEGDTLDIQNGDLLLANGADYKVRAAGPWDWPYGGKCVAIVLEDTRGSHGG